MQGVWFTIKMGGGLAGGILVLRLGGGSGVAACWHERHSDLHRVSGFHYTGSGVLTRVAI
jgi:hypothetical protein